MTATLERTRAKPEDFPPNLSIPFDLPMQLIEMPRSLGFTAEDFGFGGVSLSSALSAVDEEEYARMIDCSRYIFLRAMLELDIVEEWQYDKHKRKIPGSVKRYSRWECKKVRTWVKSELALDGLENHWVHFTDLYWEDVLPHLEFVDPKYFNGVKDRPTRKEWQEERDSNPITQRNLAWLKKAKADYRGAVAVAEQVEAVKERSALPVTWAEIEDADYIQLKSFCVAAGVSGAGKKDVLMERLAEVLSIEPEPIRT